MKKLLFLLALIALPVMAQTDQIPAKTITSKVFDLTAPLLTATNWAFGAYAAIDNPGTAGTPLPGQSRHKLSGGIGAMYNFNELVGMWLRVEYNGKELVGGNGNLAFQMPLSIAGGKAFLVPNAYAGVGTKLADLGNINGALQGIIGAGFAVRISKFDVFTEYEKRSNEPDKLLFGMGYRF